MSPRESTLPTDLRRKQHRQQDEYELRQRLGPAGRELMLAIGLAGAAREAFRGAIEGPESTDEKQSRFMRGEAAAFAERAIEHLRAFVVGIPAEDRVDQARLAVELDRIEADADAREVELLRGIELRKLDGPLGGGDVGVN